MMTILADALDLPAPRRVAFLDSTCGGEPELRREIDELLEGERLAAECFDVASEQIAHADPQRIGPYTAVETLGEGGMAIVYKAEQRHPVRRTVAIKLIKLGMDTRQFVARFEAERQALALMDHPNVARVYDAGAIESGRPYFVMEYVPGRPINEYCDERGLGVRHRLEVFLDVCDAVEHAHRKGVLHRDIKNSNVLVTERDGQPVPKVIDFGVAKALQQPLTDRTLQTELGQLIGTPEYMSPEQAERGALGDIDTRSDVYSLGVLLYELIAGVQPISSDVLRSGGYEQVQRIIRETQPPRPSARLSTLDSADAGRIARRRRTALPTLIRDLRSELEWIPLKAMRKDREQRYRSAAELADDIRNYLDGRALIAGPETARYKLRKLLRRHKAGVIASAAMILLLVAGIITTTWQAIRAANERDNAKATLAFLTDDVLAGATPDRIPDVKVRDQIVAAMITPAAERVGEAFTDRPLIEANIRTAIQRVLREIGRNDLALPHAEAALALRRRLLGDDHLETISASNSYAVILQRVGRAAEAELLARQTLERYRRVLGDDHPDTISALNNYAYLLEVLGRAAEAEPLYRSALSRRRSVLGEDHPDAITSLNNYAMVLRTLGRATESEPLAKEALERARRVYGPDHPNTLKSLSGYANVLWLLGRSAEAEPLDKEVLDRCRRVLGDDHPSTIQALGSYAAMLHALGRAAEAEPLAKQALESQRRVLGEDHRDTIMSLGNYAHVLWSLGRRDEAEPVFDEELDRARRALGADHPDTIEAINDYAYALSALGKHAEAEPLAREGVARAKANPVFGPAHARTKAYATSHAKILDALGRKDEAAAVRKEFGLPDPATQPTTRAGSQPTTARPPKQPATRPAM